MDGWIILEECVTPESKHYPNNNVPCYWLLLQGWNLILFCSSPLNFLEASLLLPRVEFRREFYISYKLLPYHLFNNREELKIVKPKFCLKWKEYLLYFTPVPRPTLPYPKTILWLPLLYLPNMESTKNFHILSKCLSKSLQNMPASQMSKYSTFRAKFKTSLD